MILQSSLYSSSLIFSSVSSYAIFVFALIYHYFRPHFFCCTNNNNKTLHPFNGKITSGNDGNEEQERKNKCELPSFWIFLISNIAFWIVVLSMFYTGQYHIHKPHAISGEGGNKTNTYKIIEATFTSFYFYSHFCTITSCFIFSKLMYLIQKTGEQQKRKAKEILENEEEDEDTKLKKLIEGDNGINGDNQFIECATKTLHIFQFWFSVHWVFYVITSFLTIALSIEAILLLIRATQHHIQNGVHFSDYEIILLVFLSVSNVLMFIYPCLRAASITRARKKFIQDIIKEYGHSTTNKEVVAGPYVKHLKSRKFGFHLNAICTSIPFSLNIAYVSICVGAFGIVLSILTSIAV